MQPFYVTGLPRSRTAWLSVALSDWSQSACLHEPLLRWPDSSAETAAAELAKTRTPFAGMSDSGLAVAAPDLVGLLPGPSLIVWRNPIQVLDSLTKYMPGSNVDELAGMLALLHHRLAIFHARYEPMVVQFDALSDINTMREIWHHLLPGVKFQRRRIESLQSMRIDPDPATLLDGTHPARMEQMQVMLGAALSTPPS